MRFSVTTTGAEVILADLRKLAGSVQNYAQPLAEAGAYLLTAIWQRISSKPPSYSERYRLWLISRGEWGGKLVGILTGAMLGAMAPGAGDLQSEVGDREALVGFLNPAEAGKCAGFARWFQHKYGEPAIAITPADGEAISAIFERWAAGLAGGT